MPPAGEPGTSPAAQAPSRSRWRRALRRLSDGLWFIPAVYVILALALGSGMLAFTGFVTSIVLLIIQFGTSEFSPRFLGWFRTDPTLKYALSTFVATFQFALISTAQMGRSQTQRAGALVPDRQGIGMSRGGRASGH